MATKKTKNAKNATEYIDSAGVKLNNNADLIIEANAAGDVVSARNTITGTEYVGGSSGGEALITITDGVSNITYNELAAKVESGILPYFIKEMGAPGTPPAIFRLAVYTVQEGTYGAMFIAFTEVEGVTIQGISEFLGAENGDDFLALS